MLPSISRSAAARVARQEAASSLVVAMSFPEGKEQDHWLSGAACWERQALKDEELAARFRGLESMMREAWASRHSQVSGTRVLGELALASRMGPAALVAKEAIMQGC
jgi:hypothetical protein